MLPLTGYTDRISVVPGGQIGFKISSTFEEPYTVDLVRIRHGDPNPAGPGLKYQPVEAHVAGNYPSRHQPVHLGSYAVVADAGALDGMAAFTAAATIWPTLPGKPQAVLSRLDGEGRGFVFSIDADGAAVTLSLTDGAVARVAVGKPPRPRAWYRAWARFDPEKGELSVGQVRLRPQSGVDDQGENAAAVTGQPAFAADGPVLIGARRGRVVDNHFNGKIEAPALYDRALALHQDGGAAHDSAAAGVHARWDFSLDIPSMTVRDTGPHGLHGALINLPVRGMKGSNWSGREMCWRHAAEEYGAIHFHEDDIYDCGWETDFTFEAPADFPSGVYGARLRCGEVEEIIPFYVRPRTGEARSDVAFLASTFTYQVYANHQRNNTDPAYEQRVRDWGARTWNPDDHHDYGHSTYNYHSDGSGISYASRLRPIMTMRPNFLTFYDPRGSGLRHYSADTHILDWLEAMDHGFDVITDEDLDDEGVALIAPYKAVLTGSHPEYHTEGTLDALQAYVDGGGNLMYLGGNGFYWRVARNAETPGMVEIRRGEGGIRAWAAEPGEYYHALDGSYGGLWRRNDRPPQRLAGVGFSSQGMFEGSYYRRLPGADDPRTAWIFDGVDDEIIGNFGLSGGGAAGFELDRADRRLGTPDNAVVVASSEGHSETFVCVPEELLTHITTTTGERPQKLIRADMTYFDTVGGGAVFSVGSITFCGSLSHNDYDNNISRIINNVLTRFRRP